MFLPIPAPPSAILERQLLVKYKKMLRVDSNSRNCGLEKFLPAMFQVFT